jgi:Sugar phosphate isomerases/epimerases
MNLGIVSDEVSQDPDHAFRVIKGLGASFVEIRDVWGRNVVALEDQKISELKSLAEKYGLEISNVDSYAFKTYIEAGLGDNLKTLKRAIEITKKLDLEFTRIFTFWWEGSLDRYLGRIVELLGPAIDMASDEGVLLAVENEYSCMVGTGREAAQLLERAGGRWLKVLWDPGNSFFARETPYPDGFNYVRDHVVHIHLKDARVEGGAFRFKPIGIGAIDYRGHLKDLASWFRGVISLETHYTPPGGTKQDGTTESFKGLLALLSELGLEK